MDILSLINEGKWNIAIKNSGSIFLQLEDGKNIFHYACVRGNNDVINEILKLKSNNIFNTDFDGNTGCHLLAIAGWDKLLLDVITKEPLFLSLKNNNDQFIFNIVLNRPSTLIEVIKAMKLHKYDKYLDYVKKDGKTIILDIIKIFSKTKNNAYTEVLKEFTNFNVPKNNLPINYCVHRQIDDIFEWLVKENKIEPNLKDQNDFTPLLLSLLYKNSNYVKLLLNLENIDVNYGGGENRYIPLTIAIRNEMFDILEILLERPDLNYNNIDNMLNIPAFYLIEYLKKNDKDIEKQKKICEKIFENSDLSHKNLENKSCEKLLESYDLLNKFKIGNTKIVRSASKINPILNSVILPISKPSYKSGVFNADSIHNIAYLTYILTKYKESIIPVQYPNTEKRSWDTYIMGLSLKESKTGDAMLATLGFYTATFFSVSPHIIFWRDKCFNYVNPNMDLYLRRAIKSSSKYVLVKLTLSPHKQFLHSNIVIYDKTMNTLTRFEPYGDWDIADSYHLDKMIIEIFSSAIKHVDKLNKSKIEPSILSTLKFMRPAEYLDKTKFQSASLGDDVDYKNLGDPEGYCLAWSYWFVELKMLNPNINEKELVRNAFNKITQNTETINPILQHIRGYARHLDKEKNKIFNLIGIDKQLHYKLHMDNTEIIKIANYVDNFVKINLFEEQPGKQN